MEKLNYDSYCGIYCGACDIIQAYKTGKKHKISSFWSEENIRKYHSAMGNDISGHSCAIHCHGCKSDSLFINCSFCKIRECAINKKLEHCIDCSDYPCSLLGDRQQAQIVLPHLKKNHPNMESIRNNGTEKWLAEQKIKWQCPKCKEEFSWYSTRCNHCGANLKSKTYRFSPIQSALLKSSFSKLPMGAKK